MGTTHTDTLAKLAMAKLARTDPVPYNPRTGEEYELIRVLIDSTTLNQVIPNGNLVCNDREEGPGGKVAKDAPYSEPRVYEIFENQLAAVEALVETATKEQVRAVKLDLDHHTAECKGELPGEGKAKNSRPYWPSYPASFRHIMHRDPLPFRSVAVVQPAKAKRAANG